MARRDKPTCRTCNARKVRCDGEKPRCQRCLTAKRDCEYGRKVRPIAFRHSKFTQLVSSEPDSHHGQLELENGSQTPETPTPQVDVPANGHRESPIHAADISISSLYAQNESENFFFDPSGQHLGGESTPTGRSNTSIETPGTYFFAPADVTWRTESGGGAAPFITATRLNDVDGQLLHFYVCNIGPWLDLSSPERHYTYTVPILAKEHPILLYAVLSCAARISRLQTRGELEYTEHEESYQHKCVQLLIPRLDNLDNAVQDGVVLATIVILRMSEQYDEYDVDQQFHLVPEAFSHYKATGPSSTLAGGLQEATFYSYVKSDIRMAILGRCGTRLSMDSWPLDNVQPQNDADWTNRMTWLLVQTINLCFGESATGLLPRHLLETLVDEWKSSIPKSFETYDDQTPKSDPFPIVRLLAPWHIVGLQFYHASKILLAAHPESGTPFTDAVQFNRHLQKNILPHVTMLCAIAFSNDHFGCRINSSHLVAMGAQYLHGREERLRVERYFQELHCTSGWPSQMCLDMIEQEAGCGSA